MPNIVSALQKYASRDGQQSAIHLLGDHLEIVSTQTYAQLDSNAKTIAAWLQEQNLIQERVLLLFPTGIEFSQAFLGCLYANTIAVPMWYEKQTKNQSLWKLVEAIAKNAGISGILTTQSLVFDVKKFLPTANLASNVFVYCLDDCRATKIFQSTKIKKDDIAYLQYTSGSTSTPKAAIIRYKNLMHNIVQSGKIWRYTKKSRTLTWAPHSHVYGLICGLLTPLYFKSKVFLLSPQKFIEDPCNWLNAISQFRITHSGGPNFAYALCVHKIAQAEVKKLNLRRWKVAINGGERINYETLLKFSEKFKKVGFRLRTFCCAYGMSEAAGTIASGAFQHKPRVLRISQSSPHQRIDHKIVSAGRMLPGIQAIIVDSQTQKKLSNGKVGEICLKGKSVVSGYWGDDHTENPAFPKYFRTGDLGFIKKNELYITGRLKELLIVHGKKYHVTDIEATAAAATQKFALEKPPLIFQLNHADEIILLQEVTSFTNSTEFKPIIKAIRNAIVANYNMDVSTVVLVSENSLPKTPSGKIQRHLCQQKYLLDELKIVYQHKKGAQKEKSDMVAQASEFLQFSKLVANVLNVDSQEIKPHDTFSMYGFNSISITELTNTINKNFSLNLSPAIFYEYNSIGEFYTDIISQQKKITVTQNKHARAEDIAVIGVAGKFPCAENIQQFWENLIEGKNCISTFPGERSGDYASPTINWGGFIDGISHFDAAFFNISPREAELMDPQQRIFLQIVWQAIEDAGYACPALSAVKTGLFVGVFSHDYAELLQKNSIEDAYLTTGITHSILANRVSYLLNLSGPSEAIDTACSSSLVALHRAVSALQNGDCDMAIVGGVNALISATPFIAAAKAGMLSEDGQCKTFDKNANGYVRAEGAGAILLKPLHHARRDGDYIYGVIKGTAVNHGGHVSSLTAPNPNAQAEVIIRACERATIPINTLTFIETHGTGTALGDPIEVNGLRKAFQSLAEKQQTHLPSSYCGLGAVKTHIGHLESAAGIASVIKVLLSLKHKQLPANLNFLSLNPYVELSDGPFYLLTKNQNWNRITDSNNKTHPRRAGISGFGFGGTNAHVIIEEAPFVVAQKMQTERSYYLFAISAKTQEALIRRIQDLADWLTVSKNVPLPAVCFTLNVGRMHFKKRCAVVAKNLSEFIEALHNILQQQPNPNVAIDNKNSSNKPREAFQQHCNSVVDDLNSTNYSDDYYKKLILLANFYVEGYDIDWARLYDGLRQRIPLPHYPFAKEHYWFKTQKIASSSVTEPKTTVVNFDAKNYLLSKLNKLFKISAQHIQDEQNFHELGLDSIALKELATNISQELELELTPALFFEYPTIQQFYFYLSGLAASQGSVEAADNQGWMPSSAPITAAEPIAIVGMHAYLPRSKNIQEFWQHLLNGEDLVTEIPAQRWNWRDYYGDSKTDPTKTNSKWGAFLDDVDTFDAAFFNISAREANLMDPQHRLMLEVVWHTIEDAGYDPSTFSGKQVGLFLGVEFNEYQTLIQSRKQIFHGHVATGNSHALLANRVSYFFNLQGPSEVINTTCSSSLVAIHNAVNALRNSQCEAAIAGAVSLILSPDTYIITSQLGALSADGRCKTFDKSANGYVKGEGVAAVLLKPLRLAEKDGDFIYGVIKGSAVNHGGKSQSLTAPNVATQHNLLIQAYSEANVDVSTISFVETHGTGTELGDPVEIEALKKAFLELLPKKIAAPYCGLGSVKTNIGHLEPASGMAGLIKVLLAMHHGKFPANLHFKEQNPFIDLTHSPFYFVNETTEWQHFHDATGQLVPRRAGLSSFGFGGTCAHLVLEEYMYSTVQREKYADNLFLFPLSAKQPQSLRQKIVDLYEWLNAHSNIPCKKLSYTLCVGRTHFAHRCIFIADSQKDLHWQLQTYLEKNTINHGLTSLVNQTEWHTNSEQYSLLLKAAERGETIFTSKHRDDLINLAKMYVSHYNVEWSRFFPQTYRQASLPVYPFLKQRYWFDAEIIQTQGASAQKATPIVSEVSSEEILIRLKQIFAQKLRIEPESISSQDTYEVYGVDSLLGLEITNVIEKEFGPVPKTLLYEHNNFTALAKYLTKKFSGKQISQANTSSVPANSNEKFVQSISLQSQLSSPQNIEKEIAIVGISIHFPQATTLEEFWNNLQQQRNCIIEIPKERWNYADYPIETGSEKKYYKYGGFIEDIDKFDPLFFGISPREASLMDPQERIFMQCAWATFEDAGYTRHTLEELFNNEVGVFAGVTYNFYPLFIADEWQKNNRQPLDIQSFSVANRISYFMNLKGPSFVVDTACSSSLAAIHLACESLLQRECKMALAGGVNLSLHPAKYHFLGSYGFLSPEGKCASFAADGSGYVPGEGVGAVLLKPLSSAIADRDYIYGVIKSTAMNHGGKTSGYTVPNPNAHAELIKQALHKANIDPRTISYIEAHGTGTSLGDPIEIRGLQEAFENFTQDKQFCAVGSVKSNIGHLESAAGISQLAKVLLQLQHKKLVASIHAQNLNPFIDFANSPFYVQRDNSDWNTNGYPRRAGISSFGAGGTNVHVIVEECENKKDSTVNSDIPLLFILSASTEQSLKEYARKLLRFLSSRETQQQNDSRFLQNVCYTLQVGRENMSWRLAVSPQNYTQLISLLQDFVAGKQNGLIRIAQVTHRSSIAEITEREYVASKNFTDLISAWIQGANVNWQLLYTGDYQKLSLPTYPFAKRRCWVSTRTEPVAHAKKNYWLVFNDKQLGFHLQDELGNDTCITCFHGDEFAVWDEKTFYLNRENINDYTRLFRVLSERNISLSGVIFTAEYLSNGFQNLCPQVLSHVYSCTPDDCKLCVVCHEELPSDSNVTAKIWFKYFSDFSSQANLLLISFAQSEGLRNEARIVCGELGKDTSTDQFIIWCDDQRSIVTIPAGENNISSMVSHENSNERLTEEQVQSVVVAALAKILQLDEAEVDPDALFMNYGMDSILGINFVAELNAHFADVVSPMDLYSYPTANQLLAYILQNYHRSVQPQHKLQKQDNDLDEKGFLTEIQHLNEQEIADLLEKELAEIDDLLNV